MISKGMTRLDAIGPYEVLRSIDGAEVFIVAREKGEIKADSDFLHVHAVF